MKLKMEKNNNLLEYGYPKYDSKPVISKLTVEYLQTGDCDGTGDDGIQRLVIETADGGGGPFFRLSIPKDDGEDGYWSITDIHDLEEILKDFESRLNYTESNN